MAAPSARLFRDLRGGRADPDRAAAACGDPRLGRDVGRARSRFRAASAAGRRDDLSREQPPLRDGSLGRRDAAARRPGFPRGRRVRVRSAADCARICVAARDGAALDCDRVRVRRDVRRRVCQLERGWSGLSERPRLRSGVPGSNQPASAPDDASVPRRRHAPARWAQGDRGAARCSGSAGIANRARGVQRVVVASDGAARSARGECNRDVPGLRDRNGVCVARRRRDPPARSGRLRSDLLGEDLTGEPLQEPTGGADDDQDDRKIFQTGEAGDPVAANGDGGFREFEIEPREQVGRR